MSSPAALESAIPVPSAERPTERWALALAVVCLLVLSLLPVATVEIPAMVDYPNHLARMSILARAGTEAAHPHYVVTWAFYPNLAMDLLVPPVARWTGVETATRLFYLVCQLLILGGAMTLSLVIRGRALGAGLTACLFLYAMPFAFGFINFQFALGIVLLALAAWIALAERPLWLRLLVHAIAVGLLFLAHLFALGLYGFAIGIIELWRIHREHPPLPRIVALAAGMAAPVALLGGLMRASGGDVGGSGTYWFAGSKLFWLGMLNGWSRPLASVLLLVLAIPLCFAFRRGWLRFVGPGRWLAVGFGLLFLAMPFRLFDTGFVDGRVLLAAILILPAFTADHCPDPQARRLLWGVALSACLVNVVYSAWLQQSYRAEYRDLIAAFENIPRGGRLLASDRGEASDPPADLRDYPMYHAATLAVYFRDAFVPTLFTSPGKQPVRPRPSLAHLAPLEGGPAPWRLLEAARDGHEPPADLSYARNWWRDFDYLLMLHPDAIRPRPDLLEKVASGERFALYRIRTRAPALTAP